MLEGNTIGLETIKGETIGCDPRNMPADELRCLGHEGGPILDVIRAKCADCSGGSTAEARKCTVIRCPLWPYRTGGNPFRVKRELSDDQRAALRGRLTAGATL
ncbi:hypothetical protein [Novosphingobium sp.]|uniref:hypothetical protein n=1 Tax=Novosphingobium sp. TaxID=1874826 RepID=UPI00261C3EB8|nr:hypothetical protein [Novosphingobium sp.]